MHRLLERQLRRHVGSTDSIPDELAAFIAAVDEAYQQADVDRVLLERSMELTSEELLDRNQQLQEQMEAEKLRTRLLEEQSQTLLDVVQSVAQGNLHAAVGRPEGIPILSELAAGIAAMVANLRQATAEQERDRSELEETQRQLRITLQEALATQRRYVEQEWGTYVTAAQANQGYFLSRAVEGPTADAWLPAMTTAVQQEEAVIESDEQGTTMAIPMKLQGGVIGVVGLGREGTREWRPRDIAIAEAIVEEASLALESQRLFEQAQMALQEMEATQRRYLSRAWSDYLHGRRVSGYERNIAEFVPLSTEALPQVRQAMAEQRSLVLHDDGTDSPTLVVPIVLRGQPIGAMGFRADRNRQTWSSADIALAEAIGEQVALAAENMRLLDETQRRAARERLTGEITDRMRRAASVEDIAQTAVNEIYDALGTARAFARLGITQENDGGDET